MMSATLQATSATRHISPSQWSQLVDGLTDALRSEHRLIEELIQLMHSQREAAAFDNLQAVDDSVYSVQRVLLTLGEARRRRRALNARLGQSEDIPLKDLLDAMGPYATDDLRVSCEALEDSARRLAHEVTVNRQVLRETLTSGEALVHTSSGVGAPRVGRGDSLGSGDAPQGARTVHPRA